ncbi:hypothetical protein SeLEV6574_g03439 [Synchytrium endobioticum]|uniref:S1 motif domain-containing protein n=1 Tax=Synchytrium endobioticum TaxID=286115 RepID=A0A507D3R2_9FUNG|nr:hypothetical protein SeLEV6574_g03439 [Synchytrium endobioticum]
MGGTGEVLENEEIKSVDDVQQDTVASGFIKNISDQGIFVALNQEKQQMLNARVGMIKEQYVIVAIPSMRNIVGWFQRTKRINQPAGVCLRHIIEMVDDLSQLTNRRRSLKECHIGQIIQARIIGYCDANIHRFLAVIHRQAGTRAELELSMRPSRLSEDGDNVRVQGLNDLEDGSIVTAFVKSFNEHAMWILVHPMVMARVAVLDVSSDDVGIVNDLPTHFAPGMAIKLRIIPEQSSIHTTHAVYRVIKIESREVPIHVFFVTSFRCSSIMKSHHWHPCPTGMKPILIIIIMSQK